MVELFRELVGWWSWFQAVTHERWMRPKKTVGSACDADTPLDAATLASLSAALQPQPNQTQAFLETPNVVIIDAVQGECTTELSGASIVGAKVTLSGICYEQIHPESHNVVDMAYWVQRIALYGGRTDPLVRPAVMGETELNLGEVCATIRDQEQLTGSRPGTADPAIYGSSYRRLLGVPAAQARLPSAAAWRQRSAWRPPPDGVREAHGTRFPGRLPSVWRT